MLDPSVLEWVATSQPNGEFMLSLAEVRLAVEPPMAALAAIHATDEDVENIKVAFQALESVEENDEEGWARADLEFHTGIVTASHNEFLAYIVRAVRKPLYSRRLINASLASMMKPEDVADPFESPREEVLARHKALVDAIEQHDAEVAELASHVLLHRVAKLMASEALED